jgi:hypothetical protein
MYLFPIYYPFYLPLLFSTLLAPDFPSLVWTRSVQSRDHMGFQGWLVDLNVWGDIIMRTLNIVYVSVWVFIHGS